MDAWSAFEARAIRLFGNVVQAVGLLLALYFPALLFWQLYRWLDAGQWVPLPALLLFADHAYLQALAASDSVSKQNFAVLSFLPQFSQSQWLVEPQRWIGVHKIAMGILEYTHVGVIFLAIGVCAIATGNHIAASQEDALSGEGDR